VKKVYPFQRVHDEAIKATTFPHCCSACDQGRKLCPCPIACQTPSEKPSLMQRFLAWWDRHIVDPILHD
jgi:hypothetical protein